MGGKAQKAKQVKLPNGEIGIEYYDADGNKLATNAGGKKPWRNNNPGNLKGGSGAIGYDEKGFAIFPDAETGMKAKADLLRNDGRYKNLTIKEMIPVYAPASDNNDVPGYTKDLGNFSGLDVSRRLDSLSDEEYLRLMQAMARREGAIDKHGNPIGVGTATDHAKEKGGNPSPAPSQSGSDGNASGRQPEAPSSGTAPSQPPAPEPQPSTPPADEQKKSEKPADPKVAAMVEMAGSPVDNPGKSALLKPVERLTHSEMTDMINSAQGDYRGWRSSDPLKAHTYEKVQDWHVAMYGDGPQANDGGKPVEPMPIRAIPDQPNPHATPQGEDLWQATGKLGGKVAEAAQIDGADNAVKSLQRGLNMLNSANPLPARSSAYAPYTKFAPVDEDGAYGPQTDFALKHAAARLGPAKVEEAFALGRFNTFAREAQRNGNAEGLEDRTHSVFGPLFRGTADTKSPKMEGGVLQETLNDLGPRSHDDWTPLKVDNWIGPKTTEAFGKLLKSEDSDGLTAAFGRGLGFL